MKLTNKLGLPEAVVRAVAADDYSRGKADISVTGVISSPRIAYLREQHDDEITEDVSERIWSLWGRAVHYILERTGDDAKSLVEERLYTECEGWIVSGAFDRLALIEEQSDTFLLQDWKNVSVWAVMLGAKIEWERQANLYALLLRRHSFPVAKAQIVAILRDWKKREAEWKPDYPQAPVVVLDIPLWPAAQQDAFLAERVRLHQQAREGGELPLCTAEERWERPTKWAVLKEGAKRATRLCNSQEEAEALLKPGYIVQRRDGESTRCKSYCSALPFCGQGAGLVDTSSEEE